MAKKGLATYYILLATRRLKLRTWVAFGLIVILLPLVLLNLYRPSATEATWFNDAWGYRQKLTFGNTGAADSDKKVKFDIDTAALTTDKLQADCDDIRFTDINGKILPHFLDADNGACDTSSTDYYVLIPTINTGETVLYMYYGNPGASGSSVAAQFAESTFSPTSGPTAASEEKGTGPVAYWAFDEGYGSTTNDSTANNSDGTISGAAWQSEDTCVAGKCLYWDGTDDLVTVTDGAAIQNIFDGGGTISAWINPKDDGESSLGRIYEKGSQIWFLSVFNESGNQVGLQFRQTFDGVQGRWQTTTNSIPLNGWTHVAVSYNSSADTNDPTFYINGQEVTITENTAPSGTRTTDVGGNLYLGNTSAGTSTFHGTLDDLKLYNDSHSATQVKSDFAAQGTSEGISASFGGSSQKFLSDGLVGYWKMDETSGTTVADFSGNVNNGTATDVTVGNGDGDTPPPPVVGKFGNSRDFDGSDDTVIVTDPASGVLDFGTGNMSVAAWIKTTQETSVIQPFIDKKAGGTNDAGYNLNIAATSERAVFRTANGSSQAIVTGTTVINDGNWHYIVGTLERGAANDTLRVYVDGALDGTNAAVATGWNIDSTYDLEIGRLNGHTTLLFDGNVDEIRVYNRALSSSEIKSLYNWAPGPVAYYKMDEGSWTNDCSTDTVFDSSANSFSGDACPNSTGPAGGSIGKFGKAGDFDGSEDYVSIAYNSALNFTASDFTLSAWVKPNQSPSNDNWIVVRAGGSNANKDFGIYRNTLGNFVGTIWSTDGSAQAFCNSSSTLTLNTWTHVTYTFTGGIGRCFINGALETSSSQFAGARSGDTSQEIQIGARTAAANSFFPGTIDDVRIYNYARTTGQVVEDMNGGHPLGGSPVASQQMYWSFDEQSTETANSTGTAGASYAATRGGSSTTGEADDPTWKTKADCKVNGCLSFDGGDYLSLGAFSALQTADKTVTFWANPSTFSATTPVLSLGGANWYVGFTSINRMFTSHSVTAGTQQTTASDSNAYVPNQWSHFTYTFSVVGSNVTIKMYVNGRLVKTTSYATGYSGTYSAIPVIGAFNSSSFFYTGSLDEMKFYNSVLTDEQIKLDMNAGSAINYGVLGSSEASTLSDGAGNPPVGLWTFDENTGSTANDTSGNGYTATLDADFDFNGDSGWGIGKYGRALHYDGANDLTQVANSAFSLVGSGNFTVETWVKADTLSSSANSRIITYKQGAGSTDGYHLAIISSASGTCASRFIFEVDKSSTYYASGCSTSNAAATTNQWYHLVGVFNGTSNTATLYVNGTSQVTGSTQSLGLGVANTLTWASQSTAGTNLFDGLIDQTTIYNYARTPAQIAYDYNRGGPIGWWQFDECSGTTANNTGSLGTTLDGTITPQSNANIAAGTCVSGTSTDMWYNGATGKYNTSLDFDGNDDYVSIPDSSVTDFVTNGTNFAISAWVYPEDASTGSQRIVHKTESADPDPTNGWNLVWSGDSSGTDQAFVFVFQDGATFYDAETPGGLATGQWYHVVGVRTGATSAEIWLNGRRYTTDHTPTLGGGAADLTSIGTRTRTAGHSDFFDGKIDDVRIYNYALSSSQILNIMNEGAGVRFGPVTGQP